MKPYCYSPLPETGSIRLLRLLPHEDESAPVECQLFHFSLNNPSNGTYMYDALSYVWGDSHRPMTVTLNSCNLPVTVNLHAALLHLRDRHFDRVLWIDAICINQSSLVERGHQVRSMPQIYGKANSVIVWLGEAAHDSDEAIEELREAADEELRKAPRNRSVELSVLALLNRPWFRRIWVLQEVAAARSIIIKCGSAEIDGYAFCLGVKSLTLSFDDYPSLQSLIRSVTYLIRGAHFRPKHTKWWSNRTSLDICTLGELIDMYHTHEATERHDRIFALLGMSSDNPSGAGLVPDYEIHWDDLLGNIVSFVLHHDGPIQTWPNKEMVMIKNEAHIVGHVVLVESDNAWYRQKVYISYRSGPPKTRKEHRTVDLISSLSASDPEIVREWHTCWVLPASAKLIQQGDIVCVLQDLSRPTVIRACEDYFTAVMITATPIMEIERHSQCAEWHDILQSETTEPDRLLLLWDWNTSLNPKSGREDYRALMSTLGNICVVPEAVGELDRVDRLWDVMLVTSDSGKHTKALKMAQPLLHAYENLLGEGDPWVLTAVGISGLLQKNQQRWDKAIATFDYAVNQRRRFQGGDHPDTLKSISDLAEVYELRYNEGLDPWFGRTSRTWAVELESMVMLFHPDISMEDLIISRSHNESAMDALLETQGNDIITQKVVKAVAMYGNRAIERLWLLLEKARGKIHITQKLIRATTTSHKGSQVLLLLLGKPNIKISNFNRVAMLVAQHFTADVMELLLLRGQTEVHAPQTLIHAAAKNRLTNRVLEVLLHRWRNEIKITNDILESATRTSASHLKILLDQAHNKWRIIEEIVEEAAVCKSTDALQLLFDQRGNDIKITDSILKSATRTSASHLKVLLDQAHNKLRITEEIVGEAAGCESPDALQLLFDQRGNDIKITEEILLIAARNSKAHVQVLLNRRDADLKITEKVLESAVGRPNGKSTLQLLLHGRGTTPQISNNLLLQAIHNSKAEIIFKRSIWERGAKQIHITETVLEALARSCNGGKALKALIDERGAEIQVSERVLQAAASNNFGIHVMELLLQERGAAIGITKAVLAEAADNWHYGCKMVSLLFKQYGIDLASMMAEGQIVERAMSRGNQLLLELLHDKFTLESKNDIIKFARFYHACTCGELDIVQQLLHEGVPPDLTIIPGRTPLINAVRAGQYAVVEVLLATGAVNVNSRSEEGKTPLYFPARRGNTNLINLLLAYGAEPN